LLGPASDWSLRVVIGGFGRGSSGETPGGHKVFSNRTAAFDFSTVFFPSVAIEVLAGIEVDAGYLVGIAVRGATAVVDPAAVDCPADIDSPAAVDDPDAVDCPAPIDCRAAVDDPAAVVDPAVTVNLAAVDFMAAANGKAAAEFPISLSFAFRSESFSGNCPIEFSYNIPGPFLEPIGCLLVFSTGKVLDVTAGTAAFFPNDFSHFLRYLLSFFRKSSSVLFGLNLIIKLEKYRGTAKMSLRSPVAVS
jgi:hypothetical protein